MTADWPTEAREAAAEAMHRRLWGPHADGKTVSLLTREIADAVLAALTSHVQPRTDDWLWGVRDQSGAVFTMSDETKARRYPSPTWVTVRRRRDGEWEVAP